MAWQLANARCCPTECCGFSEQLFTARADNEKPNSYWNLIGEGSVKLKIKQERPPA